MTYFYKLINSETKQIDDITENENQARLINSSLRTEEKPENFYGCWYLAGHAPAKSEEILAEEKRADRDRLLQDSDIRMFPDFPISAEEKELWLLYRQYLRNITDDPKFPHVDVLSFENWLGQIHSKEPVLKA